MIRNTEKDGGSSSCANMDSSRSAADGGELQMLWFGGRDVDQRPFSLYRLVMCSSRLQMLI